MVLLLQQSSENEYAGNIHFIFYDIYYCYFDYCVVNLF